MKKIIIPFVLCLQKGKFNPATTFLDVDELEGLTFELKPVNKTTNEIMQCPSDDDQLKFVVAAGDEVISTTTFMMPEVFATQIEFEWQKHKFVITFK